jgi:hypothetical protein
MFQQVSASFRSLILKDLRKALLVIRHPTAPQIRILALDDFPQITFGAQWQDIPSRFPVTF